MRRPGCWKHLWPKIVIASFFVVALAPVVLYSYSRVSPYIRAWLAVEKGGIASILVPSTLCRFGVVNAMGTLPPSAVVLALRPADMYYAERRMISYLDPRLIPFYEAKTIDAAVDILNDLGVQYVQSTPYAMPVLYNSMLSQILSSPKYSRIVYSSGHEALYKLASDVDARDGIETHSIGPSTYSWAETAYFSLVGGSTVKLGVRHVDDAFTPSPPIFPVFMRDQGFIQSMDDPIAVDSRKEQILTMKLSGSGFANIVASEITNQLRSEKNIQKIVNVPLFDIQLSGEPRTVNVRFMLLQGIDNLEIGMSQRAGSMVRVEDASLQSIAVGSHFDDPAPNIAHQCWG